MAQREAEHLWVVMPAYNEEASIAGVLAEWVPALRSLGVPFTILAINDGSKDRTLEILSSQAARTSEIEILNKPNSGHGQSCVDGYRLALDGGASWVLQIDSDGQCDPQFLKTLWAARESGVVFGYRQTRDDGRVRWWISRVLATVLLVSARTWVKDPNVPYRLMHRDQLRAVESHVPKDFYLANVLVSVLLARRAKIRWIPIHFRDRTGGTPSVKAGSFVKHALRLIREIRASEARDGRSEERASPVRRAG